MLRVTGARSAMRQFARDELIEELLRYYFEGEAEPESATPGRLVDKRRSEYGPDAHSRNPLHGTITVSGSKNSALAIMAAAGLAEEECILENVPFSTTCGPWR